MRAFAKNRSLLYLVAALGAAGLPGCKGDPGEAGAPGASANGTPSVSGVAPTAAFLGRTLDVLVSGYATSWSDATTVDFGAGIDVTAVSVASPTALEVTLAIAPDAPVGARDITVTDGSGAPQVLAGVFDVGSPLHITASGSLAQGSLIAVKARNLDFATPFDATYTGDGFFTPIVYTNIALPVLDGVDVQLNSVGEYEIDYLLLPDVGATPGPLDLTIESGPAGSTVSFPAPAALELAARAPIAVTPATPGSATLAEVGDSVLFGYTPTAGLRIVDFTASATPATDATPAAYFLPMSGKVLDFFSYAPAMTMAIDSTDPYYALFVDGGGVAGYTAGLALAETSAAGSVEADVPNGNPTTPDVLASLPHVVRGATLQNVDDHDYFRVTTGAGDAGLKLRVQTVGMDRYTDTVVAIWSANGQNLFAGPSDDAAYLDELTSGAVAASTSYLVEVFASSWFQTAHKPYDLVVRLVP